LQTWGDIEEFEREIARYIEAKKIPSVAIAVVKNDKIVWQRTLGFADVRSQMRPDPDTVYCWFSLTKLVTASAIMQLCEQGKIGLDSPVHDYLPYFSLQNGSSESKVTVHHLLTHSSGLSDKEWHAARWYRLATEPEPDPEVWLSRLLSRYSKLRSKPGEKFSYSNVGFAVLGEVISKMSGKSYEEYVKENILEPLGMLHTDFVINSAMGSNVAVGYERPWSLNALLLRLIGGGKALEGRENGFLSLKRLYAKGHSYAGLMGSIEDLSHFVIAHNNAGDFEGHRILSEESVAAMKQCQLNSQGECLRGLGWRVASDSNRTWVEHRGGGPGFKSEVRIYPDLGLGMAVLGNRTFDSKEIADKLAANNHLFSAIQGVEKT
jgi:CubicO group peptidase (beta-lactamase class C family)